MSEQKEPRVGVGALIVEHGQVLLVLRNRAPEADRWSIPGGKVDLMERLEAAVIREVQEELGVTIAPQRLLCVTDHILPEEGAHWVAPTYLAQIASGWVENREPGALGGVGWFPLHALPEQLTLTTRAALQAYQNL